jgi:hypothetical protein
MQRSVHLLDEFEQCEFILVPQRGKSCGHRVLDAVGLNRYLQKKMDMIEWAITSKQLCS